MFHPILGDMTIQGSIEVGMHPFNPNFLIFPISRFLVISACSDYEVSLLRLVEKITNGSKLEIDFTGTLKSSFSKIDL